jgi:ABC-type uncharacterized transport system permease subunit
VSGPDETPGLEQEQPPTPTGGDYAPSVAARLAFYQRAGGIVTPLLTTVFAFFMGGMVVLATGNNPWAVYKAIFNGTGLTWLGEFFDWLFRTIFPVGDVAFPANTNDAFELRQTLLLWTALVLAGLAVAFAFRCGLFNIGGNGQYLVGAFMAIWIGTHFPGMPHGLHVLFAVVAAALMGALWAAIAGFLKATVGAHEVITTIMLNWIAYWIGSFLVGRDGPMQTKVDDITPESDEVLESARLPTFWEDPILAGLGGGEMHIGFFVAICALVVYWLVLNRTTLGYEVRATGFNPEAARYGGISVTRSYVAAMAISGLFAGLAGAIDYLGWLFKIGVLDVQIANIGFIGIAVALLGRNTAVGIALGALVFGGLINGTSTRTLDPEVFRPELAGNLTLIIQGIILLFIGADLLILFLWNARRKIGFGKARTEAGPAG